MNSDCYGVLAKGCKPKFYTRLASAKSLATRWRNGGFEPVIKEYIMGMEVRPGGREG